MSPEQMLALLAELSSEKLGAARAQAASGNSFALFNWSGASEDFFMRALIGWKTGLLAPAPELRASAQALEDAIDFMSQSDVGLARTHVHPFPGAWSALLLGQVSSPVICEAMWALAPHTGWPASDPRLRKEWLAEAWLISALAGGPVGEGSRLADEIAARKHRFHWGRVLQAYFRLLRVPIDDAVAATAMTTEALDLFLWRGRSFETGPEYLGATPVIDLVPDFHLALIWLHMGGALSCSVTRSASTPSLLGSRDIAPR